MRKSTLLITALLLILFSAHSASAQRTNPNIRFNSGRVTLVNPTFFSGSFDFAGSGVWAGGSLLAGDGAVYPLCPCGAGQTLNVNAFMISRGWGPAQIHGPDRYIYYEYSLNLNGGTVTFPLRTKLVPFDIVVPATLTGRLKGYETNANPGPPPPALFDAPLNLQGTATLRVYPRERDLFFYNQTYMVGEITYNFPQH